MNDCNSPLTGQTRLTLILRGGAPSGDSAGGASRLLLVAFFTGDRRFERGTGTELGRGAGCNFDGGTGCRIPASASCALGRFEGSKSHKGNGIALGNCLYDGVGYGIERGARGHFGEVGFFGDDVN